MYWLDALERVSKKLGPRVGDSHAGGGLIQGEHRSILGNLLRQKPLCGVWLLSKGEKEGSQKDSLFKVPSKSNILYMICKQNQQ